MNPEKFKALVGLIGEGEAERIVNLADRKTARLMAAGVAYKEVEQATKDTPARTIDEATDDFRQLIAQVADVQKREALTAALDSIAADTKGLTNRTATDYAQPYFTQLVGLMAPTGIPDTSNMGALTLAKAYGISEKQLAEALDADAAGVKSLRRHDAADEAIALEVVHQLIQAEKGIDLRHPANAYFAQLQAMNQSQEVLFNLYPTRKEN